MGQLSDWQLLKAVRIIGLLEFGSQTDVKHQGLLNYPGCCVGTQSGTHSRTLTSAYVLSARCPECNVRGYARLYQRFTK
jgi:hypothetical protein